METSGYMPYATSSTPMVPPPRLHWGWVFALSILTRGLFGEIWLVVQANWIRRVTGRSEARTWAILNLCAIPLLVLLAAALGIALGYQGVALAGDQRPWRALEAFVGLSVFAIHVITVFKMRAELESAPIDIPLGSVMTFFFGALYFQYFLRDWMPLDGSAAAPYPQYPYPNVPPPA